MAIGNFGGILVKSETMHKDVLSTFTFYSFPRKSSHLQNFVFIVKWMKFSKGGLNYGESDCTVFKLKQNVSLVTKLPALNHYNLYSARLFDIF